MTNYNASHIIEKIGEKTLVSELGFTERNLRHARSTGQFAGGWYKEVKRLCDSHGVFCPLSAFAWKSPDKKYGRTRREIQGAAE